MPISVGVTWGRVGVAYTSPCYTRRNFISIVQNFDRTLLLVKTVRVFKFIYAFGVTKFLARGRKSVYIDFCNF